ncbi:hypothetical protein OC846_006109 [Tilletia horrida]|uniref:PWWP domain-containing protein n=1 Tax=Tilletia horrida TaxID=155126 RepID=A0AAN6JPA1_9BASI|nr:hypothetical protein OC846_006109 [Tilletia horrida]
MKGYPPWPAWVTDEDHVPHKVAKQKPKIGKFIAAHLIICTISHWSPLRDVKPLTKDMIEEYLAKEPAKKESLEAQQVRGAYEKARTPDRDIREKESLAHADNNQVDEEAEAHDELAEEDEDDGGASAGTKRKRTIKEKIKAKLPSIKKQKKEKDSSAAAAAKSAPAKKKPRQSEAVTEAGDEGENEEQMSPETKQVKGWRHQLQRAFLGKTPPKESEMAAMAEIFTQVEAHPMSEEAYKQTKIGKVMKKITQIKEEIPKDSEYHFKDRAEELCKKWKNIGSSDAAAADSPAQDKPVVAPAAASAEAKPVSSSAKPNGTPAAAAGGAEQDKPAPATADAPKAEAKPEAAA